jgi:hypothetical protein
MNMPKLIALFFDNLPQLTTTVGIVAFLISCFVNRNSDGFVARSLGRSATWCAMPNGIAFLICSAYPTYVSKIADVSIAFLMGGLALVAIALYDLKTLAQERT